MDSLMGQTYEAGETLEPESDQHKFISSDVQRLFRTYLRFATAYFRKVRTLGKSVQELAAQPRLFLVDPQCAIVNLCFEIAQTLGHMFANCGRTIKHYIIKDENQLAFDKLTQVVNNGNEGLIPNTFGAIVRDFTNIDFIGRRHPPNAEYFVD